MTKLRLRVPMRPWQEQALRQWKGAGCRGIAKVVTGAGKTVFAEYCLSAFFEDFPGGRAVVLVPTVSLLDQWWVALTEDAGLPQSQIASFSGRGRARNPGSVNLMVLNTARHCASLLVRHENVMLVVDECHRAASSHNSKALIQAVATLGLSATPERQYDEGFEQVLVPRLGPVFFEYDYNAAIRDGVVAPFDLVNVRIDLSSEELRVYDTLTAQIARLHQAGDEVSRERCRRLLMRRAAVVAGASMRIPVAVRLVERNRGKRTIVFHERVDAARRIYDLLVARGHSATLYHSRLGEALRRDNLRQYRRGVFDVLVTCRALDEGMDVPETEVAVIAAATSSARQRIQRLGRALRSAPGKSRAIIYTVYATDLEEQRLQIEAASLEGASSVVWEAARKRECLA